MDMVSITKTGLAKVCRSSAFRPVSNFVLALSFVVASAPAAFADWAPTKPVEIVVGSGPSGGSDRLARMIQKAIQESGLVSSTLVVINKPGAGGAVGQAYLNEHAGDGHYLMVTNPSVITNFLAGQGDQKYSDVTPIAQLASDYVILGGGAKNPMKDGKEVLEKLKADPRSLTIGVSPGLYGGPHVGVAMLANAIGVDPNALRVIPYTSGPGVTTAALGGEIQIFPLTTENLQGFVKSGQLRAYGVLAPHRLGPPFQDVPTWKEQGYDVVSNIWRGVVGPKDMTPDEIAFWDKVFGAITAKPEWKDMLIKQFQVPEYLDSKEAAEFLAKENTALEAVFSKIKLQKQ